MSPSDLFNAMVAALQAGDFLRVSALCDRVSLQEFHAALCQQYARRPDHAILTLEQYRKMHPDIPAEVAAYHVELHEAMYRDVEQRLRRDLPGVESSAALARMQPADAFAVWLEGRSPQAQLRRALAEGHIRKSDVGMVVQYTAQVYAFETIGVVMENDRLAHVVYRDHRPGNAEEENPDFATFSLEEQRYIRDTWGRTHNSVATCRRQDDGTWRLLASHMFLSMGSMSFAYSVESVDDVPSEGD